MNSATATAVAPSEADSGAAAEDERKRLKHAAAAGPSTAGPTAGAAVAPRSSYVPDDAVIALADQHQRVSPAADAEAAGASSGSKGVGGTASSGLMIDGFLVPPHVLQALQRLDLQELRLSGRGSMGAKQLESLAKEAGLPPCTSPPPAAGQENEGPADADRTSSDAAASGSPPDSALSPSPLSSEAVVPESCSSPRHSPSSSGRGRASCAGYAGGSGSSRGSSRSSGRHSSRSGASGRSSGSGLSGRGRNSPGLRQSGRGDNEDDGHVHALEVAVAELSARSSANAAVISQLNSDITSLSATNNMLQQRLTLLTGQLRHRDMEIDHLRTDVRRLRTLVAGPIDNRTSSSGGGNRDGSCH